MHLSSADGGSGNPGEFGLRPVEPVQSAATGCLTEIRRSGTLAIGPPGSGSTGTSTTYETVADYFGYLNADSTWAVYDSTTKTAKVLSLEGFVKSQKTASKPVGAFDGYSPCVV